MLKNKCNHHEILKVLGKSGHGNKVLIADGNYPIMTNAYDKSEKIYLGVSPDLPTVPDVLKSILTVINVERIAGMEPGEEEPRSEEHTFELQSRDQLVCRLLLDK